MKTFQGNKPLTTIKQQCKDQGVTFDDFAFRVNGSDYVWLGVERGLRADGSPWVETRDDQEKGYVSFNTFNGVFWGRTPDGIEFHSSRTEHEKAEWFQALLSFFYVKK
jgi:hypothetical protein